jgi:hypothetical protein
MSDIDYAELERVLKENPRAIGPGVPCEACSAGIPANYIFGTTVYHPMGRACLHDSVPMAS